MCRLLVYVGLLVGCTQVLFYYFDFCCVGGIFAVFVVGWVGGVLDIVGMIGVEYGDLLVGFGVDLVEFKYW